MKGAGRRRSESRGNRANGVPGRASPGPGTAGAPTRIPRLSQGRT
jgi:hypothetical protein